MSPGAGWQTFHRPEPGLPVAHGCGYYPGRLWNQQFLQEAGGEVACRAVITERWYPTEPDYRDMSHPGTSFVKPVYFDADGIPHKADGERLGGYTA